jgi:hypothetical protein
MSLVFLVGSFAHLYYKSQHTTSELLYVRGRWIIKDNLHFSEAYSRIDLKFDGGFYMWFSLCSEHMKSKKMVIFKDQLTREEERRVRIASKMIHSKV